jgi:hypothetical protein
MIITDVQPGQQDNASTGILGIKKGELSFAFLLGIKSLKEV